MRQLADPDSLYKPDSGRVTPPEADFDKVPSHGDAHDYDIIGI
jgi:hypothetical protein